MPVIGEFWRTTTGTLAFECPFCHHFHEIPDISGYDPEDWEDDTTYDYIWFGESRKGMEVIHEGSHYYDICIACPITQDSFSYHGYTFKAVTIHRKDALPGDENGQLPRLHPNNKKN